MKDQLITALYIFVEEHPFLAMAPIVTLALLTFILIFYLIKC